MRHFTITFVLTLLAPGLVLAEPDHWPQLRGALADGLARGDTLPDAWTTTKNVLWKTDVPGWGWSSPVTWGDHIFVTSAVSEKVLEKPIIGGYPGGFIHPKDEHRWMVYCLDRETGKILWERESY